MSDCATSQPSELVRSVAGRSSSPSHCSPISKREMLRLERKKAAVCCLNLVRNWQVDGMPSANNGINPDADEVWRFVAYLQKRIRRHSANADISDGGGQ